MSFGRVVAGFVWLLISLLICGEGNATPPGVRGEVLGRGVVVARRAAVRKEPMVTSPVIVRLMKGYPLAITSARQGWYQVRFRLPSGQIQQGWVEDLLVKPDSTSALASSLPEDETQHTQGSVSSAVVGPARSERRHASRPKEYPRSPMGKEWTHGVEVLAGPIINVYRFGASQIRVGASYGYRLARIGMMELPASIGFGGGFSSFQTGLCVRGPEMEGLGGKLYPVGGLLFERFWGNGRSFLSGTLRLGMGFAYFLRSSFWITIEPSVEGMFLISEPVPWNVRGQTMIKLGTAF